MATRLRKLTFNEVSLVDRGANPGAHVLLFKREDPIDKGAGADAVAQAEAEEKARRELYDWMEQFWKAQETLRQAVDNIVRDESVTDKKAAIAEAIAVVLSRIKESAAGDGSVTKGAGPPPALSIPGAAGDGRTVNESNMTDDEVKSLQDQLAAAQAALAQEQAKVTETEKKAADIAKAEASRIEKTEKELAELRKSHEEAVEKAEIMEFQKRAEAEFPYTPGTAEEKGQVLRAVHKLADGTVKDRMLKSMKEADGAFGSLMREVGKAGKPATGTAVAELEAETAKALQANPDLSKATAMKQVMRTNEALAKRYVAEREEGLDGH